MSLKLQQAFLEMEEHVRGVFDANRDVSTDPIEFVRAPYMPERHGIRGFMRAAIAWLLGLFGVVRR